jgi:HlyD family secretion protein
MLVVPANAIRRHGQVISAFVVEDGIARLRLLQIGDAGPDRVVVLAGLDAGESVVTSPPLQLADGHPVAVGGQAGKSGGRR